MSLAPGPWTVGPNTDYQSVDGVCPAIEVRDGTGMEICAVWSELGDAVADAKAISATPDLISALQRLRTLTIEGVQLPDPYLKSALYEAREALEKAGAL